jgi:hypothetical protein
MRLQAFLRMLPTPPLDFSRMQPIRLLIYLVVVVRMKLMKKELRRVHHPEDVHRMFYVR